MTKTTVLTNLGEAWCAGRLAGTETTTGKYLGWGTGEGTSAKADTTLFTEASEARVAATVTVEGTGSSAKYQVEGTLVSESDQLINNAGTFTASAAGTLVMHMNWDGIDLNTDDSITFTFTIDPG